MDVAGGWSDEGRPGRLQPCPVGAGFASPLRQVAELTPSLSGLELDVVVANLAFGEPASLEDDARSESAGRLLAKAVYLPVGDAVVLVPRGRLRPADGAATRVEVRHVADSSTERVWPLTDWVRTSGLIGELRELGRPVRVAAQVWTNEVLDMVEQLEALGLQVDPDLRPRVQGSAVRYWNTKIGGHELLRGIPGLESHVPQSTVVTTIPQAISFASSLPGTSILKANVGAGGHGVVLLEAAAASGPQDVEERLAASVNDSVGKAGVVKGPYLLQEAVGGPTRLSPTVDYWIDSGGATVIGLAEQVLEGFAYKGARYPGDLDPEATALCVELGLVVAEELGRRGYRGLLNVDFVTDNGRAWIIELNVRQSAPLDQSLRMCRSFGSDWRASYAFVFSESDDQLAVSASR